MATSSTQSHRLLTVGILGLAVVSYCYSLQRFGIYDNMDGLRYLANGLSLLTDGAGSPLPIDYSPDVTPADFADVTVLPYPSIPFQIWAGLTAGRDGPSMLMTSMFGIIVYIANCLIIGRIATRFVSPLVAFGILCVLCLGPIDNIFGRVSTRPLPDTFLMLAYSASIYLALADRPVASGLSVAAGCLLRFQGILFTWTIALLMPGRSALRFMTTLIVAFILGSVALSVVVLDPQAIRGGGNMSFYWNTFLDEPLQDKLAALLPDIVVTLRELIATREFQIYVASVPVIAVGWLLAETKPLRRFLVFALLSAFYISLVSYHAMTVTVHQGWAPRYLVYPWPGIAIACGISGVLIAQKIRLTATAFALALVIVCGLYFAYSLKLIASPEPFWSRNYLPERQLAQLPRDAIIGISGTRDGSAYEVYSATKSRALMWLPDSPTAFVAADNSNVDYLVVGGTWSHGETTPWKALAQQNEPIIDIAENVFVPLMQTEYYWVFERRPQD